MKWEDKGLKSPLARARGLGSARDGVHHWLMQRITAMANIPLMIWLIYSVVDLGGAGYAEVSFWLSQPLNAILMILAVLSVFYHAALGSQVIAEDYIHHEGLKILKVIGMKLTLTALAVACIFSILKVAL
jgi:succinate dehydrogenase / fumarate reductase membrane anchor subunit